MTAQWHYLQEGQTRGPVLEEKLQEMLTMGELEKDTLVWRAGLENWTKALELPELEACIREGAADATILVPVATPAIAPLMAQIVASGTSPAESPVTSESSAPLTRESGASIAPTQAKAAPWRSASSAQIGLDEKREADSNEATHSAQAHGSARPEDVQFAPMQARVANTAASNVAVELLRQTKPWARLIAIIGFIGIGFVVIAALTTTALGLLKLRQAGSATAFNLGIGAAYLLLAALNLPAIVYLNRYANCITQLVASRTHKDLEEALLAQKSFWRYTGILTLVMICGYALAIAAAVIFGLTRRF